MPTAAGPQPADEIGKPALAEIVRRAAETLAHLKTLPRRSITPAFAEAALTQLREAREALRSIWLDHLRYRQGKTVYHHGGKSARIAASFGGRPRTKAPVTRREFDRVVRDIDLAIFQLERHLRPKPLSEAVAWLFPRRHGRSHDGYLVRLYDSDQTDSLMTSEQTIEQMTFAVIRSTLPADPALTAAFAAGASETERLGGMSVIYRWLLRRYPDADANARFVAALATYNCLPYLGRRHAGNGWALTSDHEGLLREEIRRLIWQSVSEAKGGRSPADGSPKHVRSRADKTSDASPTARQLSWHQPLQTA